MAEIKATGRSFLHVIGTINAGDKGVMGLLSLLWCLLLYPAPDVSKQGARNLLNHSNQRFHLNPAVEDLISQAKLINAFFGNLRLDIIFFYTN